MVSYMYVSTTKTQGEIYFYCVVVDVVLSSSLLQITQSRLHANAKHIY